MSSRLAAGATWPTAAARSPPSTVPAVRDSTGRSGYSSTGRVTSVNEALPQVRLTPSGSSANSTGRLGRLRVISASSRPGTSTVPGSATSAPTSARAETS